MELRASETKDTSFLIRYFETVSVVDLLKKNWLKTSKN